jgi:hypothetical protein
MIEAALATGIVIGDSRFINNKGNGIYLSNGFDICISNTQCLSNNQALGSKHGLEVAAGVSEWSVAGGTFGSGGAFGVNNQRYGIYVNNGASDNYSIIGSNVRGNTVGGIFDGGSGPTKTIFGNAGYTTKNNGFGAILTATSSTTVNHGLSVTPQAEDISITPTSDTTTNSMFLDSTSISATSFTVMTSAPVAGDTFFVWQVAASGA